MVGATTPVGQVVKVLITGAGGQVGHDLINAFVDDEVEAYDHQSLDITDTKLVTEVITTSRPDAIVHAAAWTAVDACESDPKKAHLINATASGAIAASAREVGAHLTYFSTDYVFDGTKPSPYLETDTPNPQSVYGATKLAGELAVGGDALILRISWVCGAHGANMVKTILRLAREHEHLSFVDDQRGNPTFSADLAPLVRQMVSDQRTGIFHATNQGAVSWFEFAQAVMTAAGLDPDRVTPISTADLTPRRPAPRPANSILENAALMNASIDLLPDFREPLNRLIRELEIT